ncbi:MAG: AMP-binding protein [Archangiaceae bacterium]|nr:AMP-binding protein [Archangiaceae bacterium]
MLPKTIVHRFHEQAERLEHRPALWSKRGGSYVPTSWREYAARVQQFALGLIALGFPEGARLCVMGFNREEWLVADVAAMAAGGVPVGLYVTSSAEQLQYLVGHCEAPIALVENEQYLDRLLSVRGELPHLKEVIVMEPPARPRPGVRTYAEVLALGAKSPDTEYWARVERLKPEALATLIYTSGTTGHPKGVMISHHNIVWTVQQLLHCGDFGDEEVLLSYLPLSHIAEQAASIYVPIFKGYQVYFAESLDKLPEDLRRVRPTIFFGVPRVWEKFMGRAQARMAELKGTKKRLLDWARGVTLRYHQHLLEGRALPVSLGAQYAAATRLVHAGLKARIGFDRCNIFITSAAPIGREVLDFFASVDIVLREVYGQSEVTGPTTVNTQRHTRLGTLGRPMPGVEVSIADDGEILARGQNICMGYYKEPQATAELIDSKGWLHSGDAGELDAEGYLRVTGRKKEIIVTSGGKKTAPANIEAMLKLIAPVGNALVVGDNRNYLVALLALDPEKTEAFGAARKWPTTPQGLATHAPFRRYLEEALEREVNPRLSKFETIKKFDVLPNDFTIEGGELTSTMKVRRKVTADKYQARIDALYAESQAA